jgi:hypothetical protein
VLVNPHILERLRTEDEATLVEMENKYGCKLTFVKDPAKHLEDFSVFHAGTGEELYSTQEHT